MDHSPGSVFSSVLIVFRPTEVCYLSSILCLLLIMAPSMSSVLSFTFSFHVSVLLLFLLIRLSICILHLCIALLACPARPLIWLLTRPSCKRQSACSDSQSHGVANRPKGDVFAFLEVLKA